MPPSRNAQLLQRLPHGFTATATVQIAGRGRGSNVWVSPAGSLMFSTVIKHPLEAAGGRAPVVLVQYLAAIAIVEGIKSYDKGYETLPIRIKWPNDVCGFYFSLPLSFALSSSFSLFLSRLSVRSDEAKKALVKDTLDPTRPENREYIKLAGIIVNSSLSGNEFALVVGWLISVVAPPSPPLSGGKVYFTHFLPLPLGASKNRVCSYFLRLSDFFPIVNKMQASESMSQTHLRRRL